MSLNMDAIIISGGYIERINETTFDYLQNTEYTTPETSGTPSYTIPFTLADNTVYCYDVKYTAYGTYIANQKKYQDGVIFYDISDQKYLKNPSTPYNWFEKIFLMRENTTLNYQYETTPVFAENVIATLGASSPFPSATGSSIFFNTANKPILSLSSNQVVMPYPMNCYKSANTSFIVYDPGPPILEYQVTSSGNTVITMSVRIAKIS